LGRRRRKKKPRGFSAPGTKPLYDAFTDMIDVHGPEKRTLLNTFSVWIAFAAALSTGFGGCMFAIETGGVGIVGGWIIGIVAGVIVFNIVAGWLAKDRYYRP
jgi:fructose-specific phosphotransferase system IIC component